MKSLIISSVIVKRKPRAVSSCGQSGKYVPVIFKGALLMKAQNVFYGQKPQVNTAELNSRYGIQLNLLWRATALPRYSIIDLHPSLKESLSSQSTMTWTICLQQLTYSTKNMCANPVIRLKNVVKNRAKSTWKISELRFFVFPCLSYVSLLSFGV